MSRDACSSGTSLYLLLTQRGAVTGRVGPLARRFGVRRCILPFPWTAQTTRSTEDDSTAHLPDSLQLRYLEWPLLGKIGRIEMTTGGGDSGRRLTQQHGPGSSNQGQGEGREIGGRSQLGSILHRRRGAGEAWARA